MSIERPSICKPIASSMVPVAGKSHWPASLISIDRRNQLSIRHLVRFDAIHGTAVDQGLHRGEVQQFFISSPCFFMFLQSQVLEIEAAPALDATWHEQCGDSALIGCR